MVSANAILENAGSTAALKEIKKTNPGVHIIIWAENQDLADKLEDLRIAKVADTLEVGLAKATEAAGKYSIDKNGNGIMLVNSLSDEGQVQKLDRRYRMVNLAKPESQALKINDMPLVFARALAGITEGVVIFSDEGAEAIREGFYELAQSREGKARQEDLARLEEIGLIVCDMPLVNVSEDIAKAQKSYAETINKI